MIRLPFTPSPLHAMPTYDPSFFAFETDEILGAAREALGLTEAELDSLPVWQLEVLLSDAMADDQEM